MTRLLRSLSMAEMAASIAHELNQPMTAVVTHAYACREWLQGKPANLEKASATAEKIIQESTRASVVVSRVRALFRKEEQVRELTSMNRLIQELARLLRDEAIRRDVSIRLLLAHDLPQLEMDPVQIQQVILNLAMNGMDAMMQVAKPRELIIRTEKHGNGEILVAVKDHGPGIAPEIAAEDVRAFLQHQTARNRDGTAICRGIIEAHDGTDLGGKFCAGRRHLTIHSAVAIMTEKPECSDGSREKQSSSSTTMNQFAREFPIFSKRWESTRSAMPLRRDSVLTGPMQWRVACFWMRGFPE